jgi:hypothetical protein
MVDNRNEHLITSTPVMMGVHEVQRLHAQSAAALSPHMLPPDEIDQPLLAELLRRWERCFFSTEQPSEADERLFRSLNMAKAAALLPAGADTNMYDTLRSVALWATAFEILRPAKNHAYKGVYDVLESITWNLTTCSEDKHAAYGDPEGQLRKLPVWLFGEINRLRNDTLHGNPLPPGRLVVAPGKQPINLYASLLYRMMLSAILPLAHSKTEPTEDLSSYMAYRQDMFEFGKYQRDIEVALATVMESDEEQEEAARLKRRRSLMPPAAPSPRDASGGEASN